MGWLTVAIAGLALVVAGGAWWYVHRVARRIEADWTRLEVLRALTYPAGYRPDEKR